MYFSIINKKKKKLFLFVVIERTVVVCYPGFIFAVHIGLFMLVLHLILKYFMLIWVFSVVYVERRG